MISLRPKELSVSTRVLVALTGLAAALRFSGLARQSIWVDESFTIAWAGIFKGMTWERFFCNLQEPFHALLLFLWSRLFGTSEAGLRSMEALIGTATVPLLYWAVRPVGHQGLGLAAAALLALSPFHLWYSQELRGYCLLIFFVVLSMGVFLRLADGSRRGWIAYTLASVLGLLCSLCHVFLLAAQFCMQLLQGRAGRRRWTWLFLSWAAILLIVSPWIVQFYHRRVQPSGALDLRPVAREERLRGATTSPILGIPCTSAAFPACLVVLAEGFLAPRRSWARLALIGPVLVLTGVSLVQYKADSRYFKEDARSAAAYVREEQIRRYQELHRQHRRVLAVSLQPEAVDPEGFWLQYVLEHDPPVETKLFPGVRICTMGTS